MFQKSSFFVLSVFEDEYWHSYAGHLIIGTVHLHEHKNVVRHTSSKWASVCSRYKHPLATDLAMCATLACQFIVVFIISSLTVCQDTVFCFVLFIWLKENVRKSGEIPHRDLSTPIRCRIHTYKHAAQRRRFISQSKTTTTKNRAETRNINAPSINWVASDICWLIASNESFSQRANRRC